MAFPPHIQSSRIRFRTQGLLNKRWRKQMKRFASDAFSIILTQSYIAGQHLLYSLGLLLEGVRCQYFGRLFHWYLSAFKLCVWCWSYVIGPSSSILNLSFQDSHVELPISSKLLFRTVAHDRR